MAKYRPLDDQGLIFCRRWHGFEYGISGRHHPVRFLAENAYYHFSSTLAIHRATDGVGFGCLTHSPVDLVELIPGRREAGPPAA